MDWRDSRPERLGLSVVRRTRDRLGTVGNQTTWTCRTNVYFLDVLGIARLWRCPHLCFGAYRNRIGVRRAGLERFRQHDVVYDPGCAWLGCRHHQLRTVLPAVIAAG